MGRNPRADKLDALNTKAAQPSGFCFIFIKQLLSSAFAYYAPVEAG
jgi:hypothetical protein